MRCDAVVAILLHAAAAEGARFQPITRRAMLLVIGGACPGAASAATVTGQSGRKCKTISNPAVTTVTSLDFGLRAGRLSGCAADEACVSSSAVSNPSKYAPPWQPTGGTPEFSDTNRAWRSLISAVEEQPGLQIV